MWYALAFFPKLKNKELDRFREKYDPSYTIIREHMPLVFMIPESFGLNKLKDHIKEKLEKWKLFEVHFTGIKKTWDHWMLLTVREGADQVIELHDDLYSGMLESYHRKDLPFDPHIGLGLFASEDYDPSDPRDTEFDLAKYEIAKKEAESLNFDFWCEVNELTLVRGDKFDQPILNIDTFYLKKS